MLETFHIFIIVALGSNTQCCGFKQKCWNCRFVFEPHAEARAERDTVTSETGPLHSAQEVLGIPQEADKPDRKRKPPMDYLSWSFQGGVSLVFCVSLICCGVEKLISLISDPTLTFSCFRVEILHNAESQSQHHFQEM